MSSHAKGTFEVKLTPQEQDEQAGGSKIGRLTIEKQFHGDLEGASKGHMLSATTQVEGSAGYVAIERVSATLQGRKGTFVLQHHATMSRGTPDLNIAVVPDSGADGLAGITGKMTITIVEGKHFYEFDYSL
ncbi:MAG TPA: DUF3224 domain-containing protein [Blastocatellia bacterium]|nr:DUF3224 domain-containing protein [Blastocatellia bacterium]